MQSTVDDVLHIRDLLPLPRFSSESHRFESSATLVAHRPRTAVGTGAKQHTHSNSTVSLPADRTSGTATTSYTPSADFAIMMSVNPPPSAPHDFSPRHQRSVKFDAGSKMASSAAPHHPGQVSSSAAAIDAARSSSLASAEPGADPNTPFSDGVKDRSVAKFGEPLPAQLALKVRRGKRTDSHCSADTFPITRISFVVGLAAW